MDREGRPSADRVVSAPCKGVAGEQAPCGQGRALECTLLLDGRHRVFGAGRRVSATGRKERAHGQLVDTECRERKCFHRLSRLTATPRSTWSRERVTDPRISVATANRIVGRATSTRS